MKYIFTITIFLIASATGITQENNLHFGNSEAGKVLTTDGGMVVYTYDADPAGRSVCVGGCAAKWPPVIAPANANTSGEFSIITRPDGTRQWAFRGKALYQWVMDLDAGQATGNGVGKMWHVVKP